MSNNTHEQALSRLQNEVNLVLEHTGRLFAAANSNSKAAPVAHASKLKQILPGANHRFHDALDQLEEQIQTAKLVMRRDLAVCTNQTGSLKQAQIDLQIPEVAVTEQPHSPEQQPQAPEAPMMVRDEDEVMQDVDASRPVENANLGQGDASEQGTKTNSKESQGVDEQPSDPKNSTNSSETNEKATESSLQINTQPEPKGDKAEGEQQADEDKPPDTGTFSNTNDLESLFGAPLSAGAGDGPDFNVDGSNNNDDFDFDFGTNLDNNATDNDNMEALLPGLQDYANHQPNEGGPPDFDALFTTEPGSMEGQGDGEQPNMQHRDSTFDDLFDLTDFNPGDFSAGGEAGASNENQDFDFNFD